MRLIHGALVLGAIYLSYHIGCRVGAARARSGACPTRDNGSGASMTSDGTAAPVEVMRQESPDAIRAIGL